MLRRMQSLQIESPEAHLGQYNSSWIIQEIPTKIYIAVHCRDKIMKCAFHFASSRAGIWDVYKHTFG